MANAMGTDMSVNGMVTLCSFIVEKTNVDHPFYFWGGIRFAHGEFEQSLYESRVHDVVTHQTTSRTDSAVEWLNLTGAGVLHNEKSPAILSISKSPAISSVNISHCASHGITLVSPVDHARLLFNRSVARYVIST
ncbi:hypothetical protein PR048_002385 [Dryococelus australis]|uniref:Uncharacterized protein n=1 Tax=Dryococelus australis TaxID=614101 RepID=A0ABQ9ILG5_9NEOP|nr:hypothetical protein PR048_002385 [Dryococelus australis]